MTNLIGVVTELVYVPGSKFGFCGFEAHLPHQKFIQPRVGELVDPAHLKCAAHGVRVRVPPRGPIILYEEKYICAIKDIQQE